MDYEVEFENGEVEIFVVINVSGVILEIEIEMELSVFLKVILDYVVINYKG